jgi:hypothetical protein
MEQHRQSNQTEAATATVSQSAKESSKQLVWLNAHQLV